MARGRASDSAPASPTVDALGSLALMAEGNPLVEELDPHYYYRHVPSEDLAGRTPR